MSPSAQLAHPATASNRSEFRFVARQPILTREQEVFGYELLFRDGVENFFRASDFDAAARSTLDSSLLMGLDVLCDGKRAFFNCTRDVLLKDCVTLLPAGQTVVEILESSDVDPLVLEACKRLKLAGYTIALDDFVAHDPRESMAAFVDILKVDFKRTNWAEREAIVNRHGGWRCRLLAEKVESQEEFLKARNMGFFYFQGYFFRRPEVLQTREIPANRINYLRLIQAVSRPEMDLTQLEGLIKSEASVLYRLLRYLNSARFGFAGEIHTVRHAMTLLGERELRRWVRLVALVSAGVQKSTDLVLSALVRARFCELLSSRIHKTDSDLFLVGLLSVMDAILEIPMAQILEKIPIDQDIRSVLLNGSGPLRPVYQLMLAREAGSWESAREFAVQLGISESQIAECWWDAMKWAREVHGGV